MRGNIIKKKSTSFTFEKTPRVSLSCKLVPVHHRENENDPFMSLPKLLSSSDRHLRINVKSILISLLFQEIATKSTLSNFCHFLRTTNSLSRKPTSSIDCRGHVIPANISPMVLWIQLFTKHGHVSRILSVLFNKSTALGMPHAAHWTNWTNYIVDLL